MLIRLCESVLFEKIQWCCSESAVHCFCLLMVVGRQATINTVSRNVAERMMKTRW